jgi:glycosyltransferase involved in cell wall biosynthesis
MVSVIIRNRNEERYIGHAIQSVHDFLGYDIEIILVDNESTDNSIRVVNTFEYLNIKRVDILKDDYTPGKSVNAGVQIASHDYILVLSAHCQITKLDFNEVKDQLDSGGTAIWGKQIPIWNGKKINRRYMWANFKDTPMTNYFCKYEDRYFLHNAFAFYKKEDLIKHPFDEHWSSKEERYWANDMINDHGAQILYNNNIECNHFYTQDGATWKGIG